MSIFNITDPRVRVRYQVARMRKMASLERNLSGKIRPILKGSYADYAESLQNGVIDIDPVVDSYRFKLTNILKQHYLKTAAVFGTEVFREVEKWKKAKLPVEVKTMQDEFWKALALWIGKEAAKKVVQVGETTKSNLKTIFSYGIRNGKSYREIAKDIIEKGEILSPVRAMRIARTETHAASNKATDASVASTRVKFEREWDAAQDERVREDHRSVDTQRRDQVTPFNVGGELLMFPGDGSLGASAGNLINCRCVLLYYAIGG